MENRDHPTTIKLFLAKGQPDGLRTAEISNWSGKAIAGPRSDLKSLRERKEIAAPGIYFLIGKDDESNQQKIYIGEAENVAKRLGSTGHADKDFWISVISFVSKDSNLTKAHIRFLEGRIIENSRELGLAIENDQSSGSALPESDSADMELFLDKVYQLLPVLGLRLFEVPEKIAEDSAEWLYCKIKGLKAKGRRTPNGFLVTEGSQAVLEDRPAAVRKKGGNYRRRQMLMEKGILEESNGALVFTRDYEFTSPSLAGGTINGGSTNGLTAWKNKQGVTLKELEVDSSG